MSLRARGKLACLSEPVFFTSTEKPLAYYEIWPFAVNYESVMN